MDALLIADWQKEIGRLLGAAAADYPPDELLHGAELMKDDWRETGESFARALLSDLSSDETPAEYRRAFAHYKNCGAF